MSTPALTPTLTLILTLATVALATPTAAHAAEVETKPRVVTLQEALSSTRRNNITWKSLAEVVEVADARRRMGLGFLLPKIKAEGQWLHMGERHVPDFGDFAQIGELLGTLTGVVIEKHPDRAGDFVRFMDMAGDESGSSSGSFGDFVPPKDTFSATFSVVVPVLNLSGIPALRGAYDRYDAAVQTIGHGREKLLFEVGKLYMTLLNMQRMVEVTERKVRSTKEHHRSNAIKAKLQAATQLEVKRAELAVTAAESERATVAAGLEKLKATFNYLTGLSGRYEVVEPTLPVDQGQPELAHWLDKAKEQRRDLGAARIEVLAAEHEVGAVQAQYLPTLNVIGQGKADNAEKQRFDDDPFSWNVVAVVSANVWDGGIREANLSMAHSGLRVARLAVQDLERQIESEVRSARQALIDATAARQLAKRQVHVAHQTKAITEASEQAGAVTSIEVRDVNDMLAASEAGLLGARLQEVMAYLDLLAAAGESMPFGDGAE